MSNTPKRRRAPDKRSTDTNPELYLRTAIDLVVSGTDSEKRDIRATLRRLARQGSNALGIPYKDALHGLLDEFVYAAQNEHVAAEWEALGWEHSHSSRTAATRIMDYVREGD